MSVELISPSVPLYILKSNGGNFGHFTQKECIKSEVPMVEIRNPLSSLPGILLPAVSWVCETFSPFSAQQTPALSSSFHFGPRDGLDPLLDPAQLPLSPPAPFLYFIIALLFVVVVYF